MEWKYCKILESFGQNLTKTQRWQQVHLQMHISKRRNMKAENSEKREEYIISKQCIYAPTTCRIETNQNERTEF